METSRKRAIRCATKFAIAHSKLTCRDGQMRSNMKPSSRAKILRLKCKRAMRRTTKLATAGSKSAHIDGKMKSQESVHCWKINIFPIESPTANCGRFFQSGLPRRVLISCNGSWEDLPAKETELVIDAFKLKKTGIKILMEEKLYFIDFLHMLLFNFEDGYSVSIAWIDENDKCFFPRHRFDHLGDLECICTCERNNARVVVDKNQWDNLNLQDREKASGLEEVAVKSKAKSTDNVGFGHHEKLIKLGEADANYLDVMKAFLTGFSTISIPIVVVGIHRYIPTDSAALERLASFEKQIEITKAHRGEHNLQRGWFGSSKECISEILSSGFGVIGSSTAGIYLASEDLSYISACYSDIDENDVQHVLLCRVILGRVEQVTLGSEQCCPSSVEFDNGVDDLRLRKHYVIWGSHLKTHIHPEYVVSFKLTSHVRAFFTAIKGHPGNVCITPPTNHEQGSSADHLPNDARASQKSQRPQSRMGFLNFGSWMPFPLLFAAIEENLSPLGKVFLTADYNAYKERKIGPDVLMKRMRMIGGDKLLLDAMERLV